MWQEIMSFLVPSTVGVLAGFVNRWTEISLERQRGCNLIRSLDRLPAGSRITVGEVGRTHVVQLGREATISEGR